MSEIIQSCEHLNSTDKLYLMYSFSIEPKSVDEIEPKLVDEIKYKIKQSIDLKQIVKNPNVLKNIQVKNMYCEKNLFCPFIVNEHINTYYCEYVEQEFIISILFYEVLDLSLLINIILNKSELLNKRELQQIFIAMIHRTININNNILSEYDKYFECQHNQTVNKILSKKYENFDDIFIDDPENKIFNSPITKFNINFILNEEIKQSQLTNINRMINLEIYPIYQYIGCDKLLPLPNGKIFNYNQMMIYDELTKTKIKGGLVIENPSYNNIFQLLCLAMRDTSKKTLVITPEHLKEKWLLQFKNNFSIDLPDFITIVNRSEYIHYINNNYDRIIIDEIHEFESNTNLESLFNWCVNYECEHKWCVISSMQFFNTKILWYLLKYLSGKELNYQRIVKFKIYEKLYEDITIY